MSRGTSPASLANLERGRQKGVPFTPETAPRGRKSAGLSCLEWINQMRLWTRERLAKLRDNERAPELQRQAAQKILDGEFWKVVDYTHGLPKQTIERVDPPASTVVDIEELAQKLVAMGWDPATMPPMLGEAYRRRQVRAVESVVVEQTPSSEGAR